MDNDIKELDQELLKYLENVELELEKEETDVETTVILIDNVLEEIQGHHVSLAVNDSGSRIIEKVLNLTNSRQFCEFFDTFKDDHFHVLFTDRFGSHVVEKLLHLASNIIFSGDEEYSEKMQASFINMCETIEPHCFDLMSDQFATHVIRTVLNVLCGEGLMDSETNRSKKSQKYRTKNQLQSKTTDKPAKVVDLKKNGFVPKHKVPTIFVDTLARFVNHLSSQITGPDLRILAVQPSASPLLQLIIQIEYILSHDILQVSEKTGIKVQNKVLQTLFNADSDEQMDTMKLEEYDMAFETLTMDAVGSHFMDCLVELAPSNIVKEMFELYFKGHVRDLSLHNQANFVISHLIANAPNEAVVDRVFFELSPAPKSGERGKHYEKLLRQRKHNVLTELAKACLRFRCHLDEFVEHLLGSFGIVEDSQKRQAAWCVIFMQHIDRFPSGDASDKVLPFGVSIAGTQLFTILLKYPHEQQAIFLDGFLSLNVEKRVALCCDVVGSRLYESVFASAEISRKIKTKIFLGLLDEIPKIAMDKNGSHVVDSGWKILGVDYKVKVAEQLLLNYNKIISVFHGKFVIRNCKIDEFRSNKKDWVSSQQSVDRKKRMLVDLFESESKKACL